MTFVPGQVLTAAELNVLDITSLTVDTDTLVVDATNDRVGINTASPSVALDVGGSVVIDDDLTVDTNTLKVDSTNNRVGILKTSPTVTLHVGGGAIIDDDLTVAQGLAAGSLSVTGAATFSNNLTVTGDTRSIVFTGTSGPHGLEIDSGTMEAALYYRTGPNSWSFEDGSGTKIAEFDTDNASSAFDGDTLYVDATNDRVGVNTSSPSYSLDVNNVIRAQSYILIESGTNDKLRLSANTTGNRPYLSINNWNGSSYVRRGYIGYPAAGSATANINIVADNGDVNISPELTINGGTKLSDPSSANELRVTTAHGYLDLGPKNTTYCHIYTDRGKFYTNKGFNSAPYFFWRDSSGIGGPLTDVSSTSLMRYVLQSTVFGTFFDYTSVRDRKERITNVTAEDSGRWIDALQPVTYIERWLSDEDEPADVQQWREADMQVGFIADDILASSDASHFAQALDDGEGGLDPAGWKWECVIAAAVAEIKSLRARVATLESA